ncbi:Holliday junction resolvase RuvX [Buchnera aphidicola (Macrosiphoniella sanborni)]|uniref:Putative pre-16S rRNA nuclease n=1 Tax=Buchnera aphidicola (Macrosiphoniella sanborni) TaxID=1241865 RepID=A0A4D6YC48_9GAMM|nr:Holliday junction resolvase RuvX [Buchnera aphidicola]QCI24051.1 Holliday junction resolvase RuvX [Buchnera aphidicola (Macrosiphoniella sanborni)]
MIILAFDFGIKKIGVAVGENITKRGRPLKFLHAQNGHPDWNLVKYLIHFWKPKFIIVGLPLNINGTKQTITKKSEAFAHILYTKFKIIVKMHDERLTTVEAKSILFNKSGFKSLKKRERIHSYAAVIILESWFNEYD